MTFSFANQHSKDTFDKDCIELNQGQQGQDVEKEEFTVDRLSLVNRTQLFCVTKLGQSQTSFGKYSRNETAQHERAAQ